MTTVHDLLAGKRFPNAVGAHKCELPGPHTCDICKRETEPLLEIDIRLTGKGGILLWLCERCCSNNYFQ